MNDVPQKNELQMQEFVGKKVTSSSGSWVEFDDGTRAHIDFLIYP